VLEHVITPPQSAIAAVRRAAQALAGLAADCIRRLSAPPDLPMVLAGGLLTGNLALTDRTRTHTQRLLPGAPVQTLNRPPIAGAVALAHAAAATAR
jgi:hypothetical protein